MLYRHVTLDFLTRAHRQKHTGDVKRNEAYIPWVSDDVTYCTLHFQRREKKLNPKVFKYSIKLKIIPTFKILPHFISSVSKKHKIGIIP